MPFARKLADVADVNSLRAVLRIRIWNADRPLPEDLGEVFAPHAEHVTAMLQRGFTSGEICDEEFTGWWEIERGGK